MKQSNDTAWGGLKPFWEQVWQSLLLLFITAYVIGAIYFAFGLSYFIEDSSMETGLIILCVFAIFAHFVADFIWEYVLNLVKSNYWCEWLANFIFFLFVIGGLVAWGIFLYESYLFWVISAFSLRIVPLVFGILLFTSFIFKIMHN